MGQGQPDVQWPETGLEPQSRQQQDQRQAIHGQRLPGGEGEIAARGVAAQHQPSEQSHFAADRQLQVQPSGATGAGPTPMHDQPIRGEAHGAETEVEAQGVGRNDQHQVAGQRQQPKGPEAKPMSVILLAAAGEDACTAPQQRGEAQPGTAKVITGTPAHAIPEHRQLQQGNGLSNQRQRRNTGHP